MKSIKFGAKFQQEIKNSPSKDEVRFRCKEMLVEALKQVNKRIPPAKDVFKNLSYLNPACVLSQTSKANVVDLPFQHLITSAIEEQYRKVNFVNWLEEKAFQKNGIPQD
ncbi:hypothetical protein PoB_001344400 [Plakobranchus ocellatus]|uniref:Uncharacterized protein n=1 Tax=Plakobranchus ocellatus TaxID=259542 RepID=A0AAV3YV38_9GAST|nr:hypothetical protein PoB_001344400 [Plakobranchus ocellatus]